MLTDPPPVLVPVVKVLEVGLVLPPLPPFARLAAVVAQAALARLVTQRHRSVAPAGLVWRVASLAARFGMPAVAAVSQIKPVAHLHC